MNQTDDRYSNQRWVAIGLGMYFIIVNAVMFKYATVLGEPIMDIIFAAWGF